MVQARNARHWTAANTASMGRGKRLVRIEVHDIHAEISAPCLPARSYSRHRQAWRALMQNLGGLDDILLGMIVLGLVTIIAATCPYSPRARELPDRSHQARSTGVIRGVSGYSGCRGIRVRAPNPE